jgi:hypothetical protein
VEVDVDESESVVRGSMVGKVIHHIRFGSVWKENIRTGENKKLKKREETREADECVRWKERKSQRREGLHLWY